MEYDVLYHGDCLDVLKQIPSESIDLVVTDPPYKLTPRGCHGNSGGMLADKLSMKGDVFKNNSIEIEEWLPQLYRILKDRTHCYIMTNNRNLMHYLEVVQKSDFHFVRLLVWDKRNKIMGTKYMTQIEFIIMLSKGNNRNINDCGTSDLLSIPIAKLKDSNGKNLHDTEKPVSLMQVLVNNSSNQGEVVFDPFAGIGSTLIAAKRSKRHFVGCEIEKKYFDIAQSRLRNEQLELSLF